MLQYALHFVCLQVADEMPPDVFRKLRFLSQHLLDFVLPEITDPEVVGFPDPLDGIRLADRDQRHIFSVTACFSAGFLDLCLHRGEILSDHSVSLLHY